MPQVTERSGRLRVAGIGGGAMGAPHLRKLAELPGVLVAGLVDPDPGTDDVAAASAVPWHASLDDLLATTSLDAVVVATPTPTHFAVVSAAIACGLHVLVEKPIASSL